MENNTSVVRLWSKKSIRSQRRHKPYVKRKKGLRLKLWHLPTEILERIIKNVHIWHRSKIRATCKWLRNVCDEALMHDFKSCLQKYGRSKNSCPEYYSLAVINQSTWAYVKAGHYPLFLGTMLSLMRNNYSNPFCPSVEKIKQFLLTFYRLVDEKLQDPYSQTSRTLYAVTLLGFMHKCKNSTMLTSHYIHPRQWRAVFQFEGSWLGLLHYSKPYGVITYSANRSQLLILLAEIMIAANTETAFKRIWKPEEQIFIFGHDVSKRVHPPKIIFTFDVYGTAEIISFFETAPSESDWGSFPTDDFILRLNVLCREAIKWGCYRSYQLEISPHPESELVNGGSAPQNLKLFS